MLRRYRRHVAICTLFTDVIRISGDIASWRSLFSSEKLCCRFVWKKESLLKNIKIREILKFSLYLWWQGCCRAELFFLGSSFYCAYRQSFKVNAAISKTAIDETQPKHI